jgi:hypothetical protein
MRTTLIALTVAAATGCADRAVDLGQSFKELHSADGTALVTVSGCQAIDGALTERACIIDSSGTSYPLGNNLIVTPASGPYGTYIEFRDELQIDPAKVSTEGDDAPIQVFAAPYNVAHGSPCCSESDPANRIAARATLPLEGGLLVTIDQTLPIGTQISVDISLGGLFQPLSAENADMSPCAGGSLDCLGFTSRMYVGEEPAVNGTPLPVGAITSAGENTVQRADSPEQDSP